MRRLLTLLLAAPFVLLGAPSAQAVGCEIVPETFVEGNVGQLNTWFFGTTGCATSQKPVSFKVVDGRIPPGTKLFTQGVSSGGITGRPTTEGVYTFTIRVKDQTRSTDTETFSIMVNPPLPLQITTETLNNGTVGEFYCCGNLFASGGVVPYSWAVVDGALPPGLALPRKAPFSISGTPTTAGTFTFTVQVTDDRDATAQKTFTITITEPVG